MGRLDTDFIAKFERAAASGELQAQFDLGLMYATGRKVPQDNVLAHMWFNLAAMNGSEEARAHRADLALEMTPAEVAEALRQARQHVAAH